MTVRTTRRVFLSAATMMAAALAATACGSPQDTATGGGDSAAPVKVGLVYSQSGALASYGKQYIEGFKAGLAYATKGTNKVGDRTIEVTEVDDAGDPAKAVSAAKDLIGKGAKIIAGSTASGVALQVAPIAAQNKVLFISGPAATDGGDRRRTSYTFRSGRQSYQDVLTAKSFIGDPAGKKVLVFAQDSAFGKANEAAVKAVIGGAGATVTQRPGPGQRRPSSPRSPARSRPPSRTCSSWPGPAPPPRPCGRRSTSRACSPPPRSSPAWTSAPPGRPSARPARRSRSCRTTSTAPADNDAAKAAKAQDPRRHARPVPPGRLHRRPDGRARGRRRAATTSTR